MKGKNITKCIFQLKEQRKCYCYEMFQIFSGTFYHLSNALWNDNFEVLSNFSE